MTPMPLMPFLECEKSDSTDCNQYLYSVDKAGVGTGTLFRILVSLRIIGRVYA